MSRKHAAAHEEEHENHERWLLTYADMITLLMALFIVLYSMSVLNKSKFEAFQSSLKQNKNTGQPDVVAPAPHPTDVPQPPNKKLTVWELAQLKKAMIIALTKVHEEKKAQLVVDSRGLAIKLTSGVLFDSGQSVLKPEGIIIMNALGPSLTSIENEIVVEGHTDNQPISNSIYPTNWELSTARATTVLRFLISDYKINPTHLNASGYADTHPEASNATAQGRAKNRRVVLLVKAPEESEAKADGVDTQAAGDTTDAVAATPAPATPATAEEKSGSSSSHH